MTIYFYCFIYRCCFLPWRKTHLKGFNIAKDLGSAVLEKLLMSKLKSSQLKLVDLEKLLS